VWPGLHNKVTCHERIVIASLAAVTHFVSTDLKIGLARAGANQLGRSMIGFDLDKAPDRARGAPPKSAHAVPTYRRNQWLGISGPRRNQTAPPPEP